MQKSNIYIETYGCQMNVADTELVCGILKSNGYQITAKLLMQMLFCLIPAVSEKMPNKEFTADLEVSKI